MNFLKLIIVSLIIGLVLGGLTYVFSLTAYSLTHNEFIIYREDVFMISLGFVGINFVLSFFRLSDHFI
jgi:hypothetical protein